MAEQRNNIGAALANPDDLVYSVHEGPVASIDAVYDCGVPLIIDGDEPDFDALIEAKIEAGHARTCIALGFIRVGGTPDEPLTADASGDQLGPSLVFKPRDLAGAVTAERRDELTRLGLLAGR